ncbi:MAG: MBL fold metallo-hydrolase [candidate division WOR-3 bacterium]
MKIRLLGTRGSIPTPGRDTVKYGGNTTCVEITIKSGKKIIIDAGSGIRVLSNHIISENINQINLFLTHSHWDHIQGFPFFVPIYNPNFSIKIFAASPTYERLLDILKGQMKSLYYPVPFKQVGAKIEFEKIRKSGISIDGVKICSILTNHPLETHAFKFEEDGKVFVFMSDNELDHQDIAITPYERHLNFIRNADILIHDSQYERSEIEKHKGWGHSSWEEAVEFAKEGNVKKLYLTHYDPTRKDKEIDRIVKLANRITGNELKVFGAREGDVIEL